MLIFHYASKKALKAAIGQTIKYKETSIFSPEYRHNGILTGSNRPQITGIRDENGKKAREFFAQVTMVDGRISKVE